MIDDCGEEGIDESVSLKSSQAHSATSRRTNDRNRSGRSDRKSAGAAVT